VIYTNETARIINNFDKLSVEFDNHLKIFEEHVRNQDKASLELDTRLKKHDEDLCHEISGIHHAVNVYTVIRSNTDYMDIKSVICMGDITVLSEKKFSKFTRWLYNKLFGWTIEDYEWAKSYQRRIFPC
jgi:hypothetical protein